MISRFSCIKFRDKCHAKLKVVNGKIELSGTHTCIKEEHEAIQSKKFRVLYKESLQAAGSGKPFNSFNELSQRLVTSIQYKP